MKRDTIKHIQKSLKLLLDVVDQYHKLYPNWSSITTIKVLLGNACNSFEDENEMTERLNNTKNFLIALKAYNPNDHFVSFVSDEVYMIIYIWK